MSRITARQRDRARWAVTVLTGGLTLSAVAVTAAASGLAAAQTHRRDEQRHAVDLAARLQAAPTGAGTVGDALTRGRPAASRSQTRTARPRPTGSPRTTSARTASTTTPARTVHTRSAKPTSSTTKPTAKPTAKPTSQPTASAQPTVTSSGS